MKIYTKTGDKGETSLFGGKRVSKADLRVEAYGTVDELNSLVGFVIAKSIKSEEIVDKTLMGIQNDLLTIGSSLATPAKSHTLPMKNLDTRVDEFERIIDKMTEVLPPLAQFILPGGSQTGALLHVARSVARRAERRIVALAKKEDIDTRILIYFNRLSDLFFTMARYINHQENHMEHVWKK